MADGGLNVDELPRWATSPNQIDRTSFGYVRAYYGVPARRGARVIADGKPGRITSGDGAHIRVRLDGEKRCRPWHPTWRMDYLDGRGVRG